ncbi:uncharacterized protein RJT21DRAFT_117589 [Scheffersomyces amazonensis]|uniref:uncharacterized protein n=1 Tax=Scheffersomyces amazonensis TaxID=1078765 RepID=UPI00315DB0D9
MSEASKRIISHMNDDHQLALIDYLVIYGEQELYTFKQSSVKLTDVNEKSFTLNYETISNESKKITIHWADASEAEVLKVNSLKDVKDKLISMAKYAAAKQGYSHKRLTKVLPPNNLFALSLYILIPVLITNHFKPKLIPSYLGKDLLYLQIVKYIPAIISKNQSFILYVIAFLHVLETLFFTIPRLVQFRAPFKQSVAWIIMGLFEGFGSLIRMNAVTSD